MFISAADGSIVNAQQITQIFYQEEGLVEYSGPYAVTPTEIEQVKQSPAEKKKEDEHYASVLAIAGGCKLTLFSGTESSAHEYFRRLWKALEEKGLLVDVEVDDLPLDDLV